MQVTNSKPCSTSLKAANSEEAVHVHSSYAGSEWHYYLTQDVLLVPAAEDDNINACITVWP